MIQITILLTGATDGIGLETAKTLVSQGHHLLLHGRNPDKLKELENTLSGLNGNGSFESYVADLSNMADVERLAQAVTEKHTKLDVLINNAGVLKTDHPISQDGLDVRFVVNTFAPYLLTKRLMPLLGPSARVINLSSAAQSPVDLEVMAGRTRLPDDLAAYAQSKLAITMWSRSMAQSLDDDGPVIIAVNPGSLLATKMVKEGFGMAGNDIRIGADILVRAALEDEFASASGQYFDNDSGQFAPPHPDALDRQKTETIVHAIEETLENITK
ncbi:short-chain dehydrogenase [Solemya velum gill symbiont]|uniref:Short-chain dehydrogenase n=1 Tax=Solemya velum gill symbiont TaxID=2340 RepID=A0A0B0H448_SOVGS|nr:short-chain dehydrogenase [Solemya velum gill symbiont]